MGTNMLLGRADAYEGFIVSANDLPSTSDEFDSRLEHSLQVQSCMVTVGTQKTADSLHFQF